MFGFKLVRQRDDHDKRRMVERHVSKISENLPFRPLYGKDVIYGLLMCNDTALAVKRSEFENLRNYLMSMREDEKRIRGE